MLLGEGSGMSILCRIQLLGGLRVTCGDRVITRFRTRKTAALLAYLACHLHRPQPREILIDLLWPESTPEAGQASLRTAISSLRRQLGSVGTPPGTLVVADRFTVKLNAATVTTDVREFEAALHAAERAGAEVERRQHLVEAIRLYGGPLLPGYYQDWIPVEQERLSGRYFQALQSVTASLEEAGELGAALEHAWRAVGVEPLREEGHQHLMRLLGVAGQPEAALRQYRELERILREELGVASAVATQQLAKQLSEAAGKIVASPPVASPAPPPLPSGIVIFLLADIEDERQVLQQSGEAGRRVLAKHQAWLREQVARHGGHEVRQGRGCLAAAFAHPTDALQCALACQRESAGRRWPKGTTIPRVRMALDTGEAERPHGQQHGWALDRAAALVSAAHAGQILCTDASAGLLQRRLEPGVRLIDLGFYRLAEEDQPERLFAVAPPGAGAETLMKPRAARAYASNLPPQFTRFFGREEELAQLRGLLLREGTRLVTIAGPPGSGKTRLALELAGQLLEEFGGAVWFVPLQDLTDAGLIVDSVLEALGLSRLPGVEPLGQLAEALSRQRSLLVLDNFEQLVEGGALEVRRLLEQVSSLTCLVTSRRGLDLTGETQSLLPPLPTPRGRTGIRELIECPSVQLFVDRAQAVRPDFQITPATASAVSTLCDRLEGIPLALELAAARAQVLGPAHMLAQLEHRFEFLVSRRRDVGERHGSLQTAVEWSYRLLPEQLQRLFRRLSVFRGGWTAEAAATVCEEAQALEYLTQLEECSLILTGTETGSDNELRFRMLETLREYGQQVLSPDEEAALRRRHAEYYLGEAEQYRLKESGQELEDWLQRLAGELDDCRAALAWYKSAAEGTAPGLRLARALQPVWYVRGSFAEGREYLREMLARQDAAEHPAARALALCAAADLAIQMGDLADFQVLVKGATEVARDLTDRYIVGYVLRCRAYLAMCQGASVESRALLEDALALAREEGSLPDTAVSLCLLGELAFRRGDWAKAEALFGESLAIRKRLGYKHKAAQDLNYLGLVALSRGAYLRAGELFGEALAFNREVRRVDGQALNLTNLACVAEAQGDYAAATRFTEQALALPGVTSARRSHALSGLASFAWRQGDRAAARVHYREALDLLGEGDLDANGTEALRGLVRIPLEEGNVVEACRLLRRCLERSRDMRAMAIIPYALEDCVHVCLATKRANSGSILLGAAEALRETLRAPLPPADQERYQQGCAAARAALGEQAFEAAWAKGRTMSWEEAVAYALEQTE